MFGPSNAGRTFKKRISRAVLTAALAGSLYVALALSQQPSGSVYKCKLANYSRI